MYSNSGKVHFNFHDLVYWVTYTSTLSVSCVPIVDMEAETIDVHEEDFSSWIKPEHPTMGVFKLQEIRRYHEEGTNRIRIVAKLA